MIYFSPDRNEVVIHCSCGDSGDADPHILIRYEWWSKDLPPEATLYADDGHWEPTLWNRLRSAWSTLCGHWPRWPGVMCLLGANERECEVQNVRALAAWLNETADRYEADLKKQEAEWPRRPRRGV